MITILITEDDANIRKLMVHSLQNEGYSVLQAINGRGALNLMEDHHIDLLVTDVMMPEMNGVELTSDLRQTGHQIPVLMVTALESIDDKKSGFTSGADDYMVKPIDMDELLMRVRALLRRAQIVADKKLTIRHTELHYEHFTVVKEGKTIELPKKEFLLVYKLLSSPKKIFTRQQLMDEIWGLNAESDSRTVDVHIKRLREKIKDIDDFSIVTVWGLGYKAEITV
ncbi:DNA-binding response regulator [Sutcliffiella horikoshii]|uniref:Heme response regulator HssR n=1 Tax=Sutcliffiella horikoshii TaxID=79883 RepID=A0ABM6KEI9_9BACI|nr:response regulator transcription factor [Sutcliffiella horikoshii]ART74858.1 DNA-binding response regulator [Sutcliffiella horikoshii]